MSNPQSVKECDLIIAEYERQFGQTAALLAMKNGRKRRRDLESGKLTPKESSLVRELIEAEPANLFNPTQ